MQKERFNIMENFYGILNLTLVTSPILKTMKTSQGGTVEYYELTLTDGQRIFNRVSGSKNYNFTTLETGKVYSFAIKPRVKNVTAIANNGNQYNKAYNDFSVLKI